MLECRVAVYYQPPWSMRDAVRILLKNVSLYNRLFNVSQCLTELTLRCPWQCQWEGFYGTWPPSLSGCRVLALASCTLPLGVFYLLTYLLLASLACVLVVGSSSTTTRPSWRARSQDQDSRRGLSELPQGIAREDCQGIFAKGSGERAQISQETPRTHNEIQNQYDTMLHESM